MSKCEYDSRNKSFSYNQLFATESLAEHLKHLYVPTDENISTKNVEIELADKILQHYKMKI